MKPIGFLLDKFDFIINPLHSTCMDRKPAKFDNTINISPQSLGKLRHLGIREAPKKSALAYYRL